MKRLLAVIAGIAVTAFMSMSLAGSASAADETATANLTMTPQSGQLSKTERKPVNWRVAVEIKAPATSPKVQPMKRIRTTFPKDMAFNPKKSTPVCPDSEIGPSSNLNFPPDTIIARCPKSVLGNGTAGLYLFQNNSPSGPTLKDPVLIVFNGGEDNSGKPKIKIYGYSNQTKVGIFMSGVLDNGVLDVAIPRLSFDSGTGDFNLNIPGSNAKEANRHGVDKSYVTAKCSTGTWLTNAQFTLGSRNDSGQPIGEETIINAPESTTKCEGKGPSGTGNRFGKLKLKGPGSVKKGSKGTYTVTLTNKGAATMTGVKVKASGKGASGAKSVGKIKAGKSVKAKVKVKFTKKGKIKTKFTATAKNAVAKRTATKTVTVK